MSFPKAVLFSGKKIVSCESLALQIPWQNVGVTKRSLVWRGASNLAAGLCVLCAGHRGQLRATGSEPQAQSHTSMASICGGTLRVEFIFLSQSFLSHLDYSQDWVTQLWDTNLRWDVLTGISALTIKGSQMTTLE